MYGESLLPQNMGKTFIKLHFDIPVSIISREFFKRDAHFYSSLILSVYLSRCNPFTNLLGGNFGATLGQLDHYY